MKIVIKGEIIDVAIIPIGAKLLKTLSAIGIVITCAPVELPKDAEKYTGNTLEYKLKNNLFVSKIPAKAP